MSLKFMFSVGFALLMSGCASYEPVNLYEGPNRPDTELAIIGQCSSDFPREKSVDGGEVFVTNIGRVLPGEHILSVKLYPLFGQGNLNPAVFKINIEAGHKYLVCSMVLDRNSKACSWWKMEPVWSRDKKTFIWLEDQMTGEVAGGHRPWIDARIVKGSKKLQYWPQNQTENRTKPDGLEEITICRNYLNVNYGQGSFSEKSLRDIKNLYFYVNWDEGLEGH